MLYDKQILLTEAETGNGEVVLRNFGLLPGNLTIIMKVTGVDSSDRDVSFAWYDFDDTYQVATGLDTGYNQVSSLTGLGDATKKIQFDATALADKLRVTVSGGTTGSITVEALIYKE